MSHVFQVIHPRLNDFSGRKNPIPRVPRPRPGSPLSSPTSVWLKPRGQRQGGRGGSGHWSATVWKVGSIVFPECSHSFPMFSRSFPMFSHVFASFTCDPTPGTCFTSTTRGQGLASMLLPSELDQCGVGEPNGDAPGVQWAASQTCG